MSDIRVQPDNAVRLTQLETDLEAVKDDVATLTVAMNRLSKTTNAGPDQRTATDPNTAEPATPPGLAEPPTWSQAATVEEKDLLVEWVDWLQAAYAPRQEERLTPCWTQHEGVVEELAALRRSWVAAYLDTTNPKAIGQWHADLATTLTRISDNWRLSLCIDRHVER